MIDERSSKADACPVRLFEFSPLSLWERVRVRVFWMLSSVLAGAIAAPFPSPRPSPTRRGSFVPVTGLRLVTHRTRGSASEEPAEPARQCVPRQEPGNEVCEDVHSRGLGRPTYKIEWIEVLRPFETLNADL
jgi:hypothetical protein